MRNIEKYRYTFINALDLEDGVAVEDLALGESPEWDSIGHMTLIAVIEDEFDVSIDSEWITEFNSYLSGMELLNRLGVDFINE